MKLAEIALNVPLDQNFFYMIPEDLNVRPFLRVRVSFGRRKLIGFVVRIVDFEEVKEELEGVKLKEILSIVDTEALIDENTIQIARWMNHFYLTPFGVCLSAMTPSAIRPKPYHHVFPDKTFLPDLADFQITAFEKLKPMVDQKKQILLHGITGSGKTEIYKHLVASVLDQGLSALILIPEIALTPQTMERFYEAFGDKVAIYHSKLTQSEKLSEWKRAQEGQARVVIGPRSAIFIPLQNLGLIVIDEEHESSYKSGNTPRYHARQIAFMRSKLEKTALLLGSATPQVETTYASLNGKLERVELTSRFGEVALPKVQIIDLTKEKNKGNVLSQTLISAMLKELHRNKQVLLFLNRRGYAPSLMCKECGHRFVCPNCDVNLTYHQGSHQLICHHCGYVSPIPTECPECHNTNLKDVGSGTEKLEALLEQSFPNQQITRMDLDTTRHRTAYIDILKQIRSGKANIIIGTQMVAKGHDIPGIQLVGALLPDIMLSLPDFRASERTFILLTQVIGRAGRRQEQGSAIIQTYLPEHYSIQAAASQDYMTFYDEEIKKREFFNYPPFTRLIRLVFRGSDQQKLANFCAKLKSTIKHSQNKWEGIQILGPVTCPIEKLNNNYRYHIIIKSNHRQEMMSFVEWVRFIFQNSGMQSSLYLEIDIDPLNMI